ncbi:hypothetical protein [Streptomyces niveus]|uniref:hypothetical protein n=1 Tax=Streptomyces niveus TaxID=193462 RepID=UPI00344307B1
MEVGSLTALAAAVVGCAGTLLSALLTQRAADHSRQHEQERAELARQRHVDIRELRACYVGLNTAARQYLAALTDQVHALSRGDDMSVVRQRLTEARDQHRDVYAEAQLRVPEQVLDLAGEVSRELGIVYGMVRRLDDGLAYEGDSVVVVQERIDVLWHRLREVRREMRVELGVPRAPRGQCRGSRRPASGGSA